MRKWIIEFLSKFEYLSIKIARVNSNLITKPINLLLFALILYGFGVRCDLMQFSVSLWSVRMIMMSWMRFVRLERLMRLVRLNELMSDNDNL